MRRVLAALGVLISVTACGVVPTATPSRTPSSTPSSTVAPSPSLDAFYSQHLTWKACGAASCTDLTVPLDYAKPTGQRITISVLRIAARDQQHKLGALLVNPGGPGGSGTQFVARAASYFGKRILDRYDIVGFDPRGVGDSTPLKCGDTALTDQLLSSNPEPKTPAEEAQVDALVRQYGAACVANSGDLVGHISTEEAARDMDVLRAALGQPTMDYFGASYGTFLGAMYANLFPTKVGRMVLDGALDPKLSTVDTTLAQAGGFETALRSYAAFCVSQGNCPLGTTADDAVKRVRTLLDEIAASPLPTSKGRQLTVGLAMYGIWEPLYEQGSWPGLTEALREAIDKHTGNQLLTLADFYAGRGPNAYDDNSVAVLYDVNCLDHDDVVTADQVAQYLPQFLAVSPTFGRAFANSLTQCADWPVQSGRHSSALTATGAAPILVLGTTRDPATPLAWAKGLASELSSAVLVTRDGDGHTAYHQQNTCIDSTVEDYLVTGTVPAKGTAC